MSASLVGTGRLGAMESLGERAAGTRNKWIHCNRMSQRCSRWTCQLLSVLTPLWVSLNVPLGHRGHHLSHFTRSAWSNGDTSQNPPSKVPSMLPSLTGKLHGFFLILMGKTWHLCLSVYP